MPSQTQQLNVLRTFTAEEFDNIILGFIPRNMDDRWFIYYEPPCLSVHRSWTGLCVYEVYFEPVDNGSSQQGMRISQVLVNQELSCQPSDKIHETELIRQIIEELAKREGRFPKPERVNVDYQPLVLVAEKMVAGEVGIVEGARQLSGLAFKFSRHSTLHKEDHFQIFRKVVAEAELPPSGPSRQHWNPEALQRKDKTFADYEAKAKEATLQACREFIRAYKTNGTDK